MAKDTKERILAAALDMFSQNGYAGTNIRELSESLGLVKSAMYRHFESKEAIWNTLLDEMIAYYEARFGSPEHLPPVPDSLEALVAMTMRMVDFTVHDETVVKTRKMLMIEQFRDERARDLATKYFLTGLKDMFTPIFADIGTGVAVLREQLQRGAQDSFLRIVCHKNLQKQESDRSFSIIRERAVTTFCGGVLWRRTQKREYSRRL